MRVRGVSIVVRDQTDVDNVMKAYRNKTQNEIAY